jgi:hypothetical protein
MASGLYTMRLDGRDLTRIGDGRDPSWSPDGSRIAFDISRDPNAARPTYRIGVMNADGSGWRLLPVPTDHSGIVVVSRGKLKVSLDWVEVEEAEWERGSSPFSRRSPGAGVMVERRRTPPLFRRQPMEQVGNVWIQRSAFRLRRFCGEEGSRTPRRRTWLRETSLRPPSRCREASHT